VDDLHLDELRSDVVNLATAWVQIQPSLTGVSQAITKEFSGAHVDKIGTQAGQQFTGGVSKGLVKLGAVVVAAFAVKAVANFFGDSLEAVKNWQVLNAQTEAVVKSTGASANITAAQVHSLAESLEGMTATQAESIQSGANMLLTFKNIRNGVGAGNDIFNQATLALVDMAQAMHEDVPTAAIRLGKALNDPIAGMGALSRVGVQFTDEQKDLIKTLVESGDVMGAQKVILQELNDQFGGSGAAFAETYAGKIFLLGDAFGDVGEKLITDLMPQLESLIDWLRDDGITAVEEFAGGVSAVFEGITFVSEQDWYKDFVAALDTGGELDLVGGGFVDNVKKKWEELPTSFENGWEQIKDINAKASDEIPKAFEDSWNSRWFPALTNGWTQITDAFGNGWEQILAAFENGGTQIAAAWNLLWTTITLAVTGFVAGILAGIVTWWEGLIASFANGWTQITTWWNSMWTTVATAVAVFIGGIVATVVAWWEGLVASFANGWIQITTWWNSLWNTIWTTLTTWATEIITAVTTFIDDTIANFTRGWDQIVQFVRDAAQTISDTVSGILRTFEDAAQGIRDAFDGIGQFIHDAFGPAIDFLSGAGSAISNFFGGIGDRARYIKGRLADFAAARQANPGGFAGGSTLARVQALMLPGLSITDTLSSPARDAAFGIVRSASSYHYDAANPAVDIAGPLHLLHQFYAILVAMGPWRQILWQVAGHYDHIHVAHGGGVVDPAWPRMWGDRWDERTVRLQVGETVMPRGMEPMRLDSNSVGSGRSAAVIIRGDVYTFDLDEFFEKAERAKRRAYALAAPVTS